MATRAEGGDRAERVLVLAPVGRDAEVLCGLLRGDGLAAEPCHDAGALASRLREGAAAVLVTEEALSGRAAHGLAQALADQPLWSDLPVLLLGGADRAAQALLTATVLPRPARAREILTAERTGLTARRR